MIVQSKTKPKPGKLISLRGREWIVLPSADEDVLLVKPLGGSEDEVTGIYLPLAAPEDRWEEAVFPEPGEDDINDFETARLLFDASRLSFRNVAGPFRCMGKLSFRPRSYQIVPLVMALRQPLTRLLIADDVGIGKTIEALIVLKEMMERGEIRRFAVICPPHLCEQWQGELKDKLDIEAEIIRSSTVSALERKLIGPESVFHQIPYQVVSIDYVKSDRRKSIFLKYCPEFIIVDEAHTCAMPRGASSVSQQQRYHLLHDIVRTRNPHLLMLTATPHSGKDEEFRSLLGLVNQEFESYDMDSLDQNRRRKIARHFIQRKRESIKRWLGEETPFPERETRELPDEQRREKIETMGDARMRLLVATDCLSEGINLQDHFNAVIHYDLPWNPNRLEQREGRVDRFGQRSPLVRADLKAVDEAIGDIGSVEHLVINGIRHLGGEVQQNGKGSKAFVQNLPGHLKELLPGRNGVPVSFVSPTPEGYHYIGRNHRFTEQLCQFLLALAFEQKNGYGRVARASVIQTGQVTTRTTIVQFRVRNVIKEVQSKLENISEEMYLWGFEGSMNGGRQLDYSRCKKLLYEAASERQLTIERQRSELQSQMQAFENIRDRFITLAEGRAEALVEAHGRFKSLVGGRRYEAVYPVLPPDILGVYVFIPQPPQP